MCFFCQEFIIFYPELFAFTVRTWLQMFIRFIAASWKQAQDLMATATPKHEPGTPFSASPDQIDSKAVGESITLLRKAAGAAAFLSGTLMYRVEEATGGSVPACDPLLPLSFPGWAKYKTVC
jgi:hypothetical protein